MHRLCSLPVLSLWGAAACAPLEPFADSAADPADPGALPEGGLWRVDSELREAFESGSDEALALVLEGDVSADELLARGVDVRTVAGQVRTVAATPRALADLLDGRNLTAVHLPSAVEPLLDVSTGPSHVNVGAVRGGTAPAWTGLTGAGVIVGIVDTGIDVDHLDFQTASGDTRIAYLWDQSWVGGAPSGYSYGSEFTADEIDGGSASTVSDSNGHGTHVAGIAAGNGQATGRSIAAYRQVGVAPEADLVVVKLRSTGVDPLSSNITYWSSYEDNVIDGCAYVFEKADELGQPAVCLTSVGHRRGAHDGSTSLDLALSALTGPGKIVVAPVGNDGLLAFHGRTVASSSATVDLIARIPSYTATSTSLESLSVEGWGDPGDDVDVQVLSPSGTVLTSWITPGHTSGYVDTTSGAVQLENGVMTSASGAHQIRFDVWRGNSTSAHPASGDWRIRVRRSASSGSATIDWWVTTYSYGSTTLPKLVASGAGSTVTNEITLQSPASADDVIAATAYASKTSWTNVSGGTSLYIATVGQIADFASRGLRRDGVQKPDVAAPGYGVMAARSSDASVSNNYVDIDGVHMIKKGTSLAAAHVAGAVALLLQEDPAADVSDVRAWLEDSTDTSSITSTLPDGTWGYGKLKLQSEVSAPAPSESRVEGLVLGTPSGLGQVMDFDGTGDPDLIVEGFQVFVADADGAPIQGAEVVVDFGATTASSLALSGTTADGSVIDCTARTLTTTTDADGIATLFPRFSGSSSSANVEVSADGVLLGLAYARSTDIVSPFDRATGPADLAAVTGPMSLSSPYDYRADLDADDVIGLKDFSILAKEYLAAATMPAHCH